MFSFTGLLIGLTMAGIGVLWVKYSFWLHNITGPQMWLERFTGSGSTNGMYKIFGLLLFAIGTLTATGFGDNVMNFIFAPFLNLFLPRK